MAGAQRGRNAFPADAQGGDQGFRPMGGAPGRLNGFDDDAAVWGQTFRDPVCGHAGLCAKGDLDARTIRR